jgi:hypothetical protein
MVCCSDELCSMREEDEQSDVQQADSWQGDEGFDEEEEDSDEEYDDSGFLAEPAAASVAGAPQSGWSILDRERLKAMQVLSWSHAVAPFDQGDCCRLAGKACQLQCLYGTVPATHMCVSRPRRWSRSSASWAAAAPQPDCC